MTLRDRALPLTVRHGGWAAPAARPRMGNDEEQRAGLEVTSRALVRDGRPWIPVSGELHYSRVSRARWAERLRLMRAGGVTVVSTYVLWIHHEPVRGEPRFDGALDLAAFVDAVRAEGLELVLRIGPWAHGEARNGGFPDWVQAAPVRHRTDDPAYLALVREWWGALATALDGRCTPENVLAIQLENELYDQPGHFLTLKGLAREAGLRAPLWTATAWGGADLPAEEVLPLWGGYGDGFWVDPGQPWDPTFRAHFFFSDVWDDPGIGADVRGEDAARRASLSPWFPPATCELGGGMATAYHRRPRPAALDIAAVAHAKLGSGSAWQGYYMYAGGTNPGPGLEESQATGYPNDMTPLSYDFHAPIGESGRLAPSHAELRRQHAFIDAFGERLALMASSLPHALPHGVGDASTLRWALRSDGDAGFVFIGWHQPYETLPLYAAASLRLELAERTIALPSAPMDIPPGTLARWPIGLDIGGVRVEWATASALTLLPGDVPTLVVTEDAGVPAEVAAADRGGVPMVHRPAPGGEPLRLTSGDAALDVLVIAAAEVRDLWVATSLDHAVRRLLLSADDLTWDAAARLSVRSNTPMPDVHEYVPGRGWVPVSLEHVAGHGTTASVAVDTLREATPPNGRYGMRDGRHAAPRDSVIDDHAAVYALSLPADIDGEAALRIRWAGDVAQLRVDGRTVRDRFWDGSDFVVDLRDCGITAASRVELHVLPLRADSGVHIPPDAAARLREAGTSLVALDGIELDIRSLWRETRIERTD